MQRSVVIDAEQRLHQRQTIERMYAAGHDAPSIARALHMRTGIVSRMVTLAVQRGDLTPRGGVASAADIAQHVRNGMPIELVADRYRMPIDEVRFALRAADMAEHADPALLSRIRAVEALHRAGRDAHRIGQVVRRSADWVRGVLAMLEATRGGA